MKQPSGLKLQVIPLGGLGEFGMNMMALRCGDDIIVIDAGMMFPGDELHGVDSVVPDITYLLDNAELVRALVLTHAHEDHIGATAYVLSQLDLPVYATAFTEGMVNRRLGEHDFENDPVIHRVTSLRGGLITTRGDANPVDDPWNVRLAGEKQYRLVAVLPGIGWLTGLRWPFLALAALLFGLALVLELAKGVRSRAKRAVPQLD